MGSSIYTGTGDKGTTSLADGSRVDKDCLRVEAYGTVDEANSWVGVAHSSSGDPMLRRVLEFLQHRLFNCSSNLASPGPGGSPPEVTTEDIEWLQGAIDRFEEKTGPLEHFVLPGGDPCAGLLHVARTVCRRAERLIVALAREDGVDPLVRTFINRSSDVLFAAARYANTAAGVADIPWQKSLPRPSLEVDKGTPAQ